MKDVMADFEKGQPSKCWLGAEEAETYQKPYRWVILALLWLLYFAFGLTQRAIAPLVTLIIKELNISYSQMGMIMGSWPLTYVAAATAIFSIATASGNFLIIGLLFHGLSFFSLFPLLVLVLMDLPEVGSKYMGSAAGMFFRVAELGGFARPFMTGAVKDPTGSFVVGAGLTAGLAGVMSVIAFHLRDIVK
jgi:fucose permease